jgi:pyruvate dehydrogenase E1 component alpha subunit
MPVANEVQKRPGVKSVPSSGGQVERRRLWMMMLIRRFEERTYQEYTKKGFEDASGHTVKRIGGFCHLYSGQEAVAVGIASVFERGRDYLVNGYRDHGHALALGMDPKAAMAELFGRATGCSKGKGGSMHFVEADAGNMGGHGIVGGQIPLGVGMAFAAWYKRTGGVSFTLFGDGAVNQGTFNESMNLASLWKLPCLLICENNGMAMGTQVSRSSAEKDLAKRGLGYAMPCRNVDGNDINQVIEALTEACQRARSGDGPSYLVMNTYRFRGHSMSDPEKYRTKEEKDQARLRDPIILYERYLRENSLLADGMIDQIDNEVTAIVNEAVKFSEQSPHPDLAELYTDILSETYPNQK